MIKLACQVTSLATKHNFQKGTVEYIVELSILGQKVVAQVDENFVAKLDEAAGAIRASQMQDEDEDDMEPETVVNRQPRRKIPKELKNKLKSRQQHQQQYAVGRVDEREYDENYDNMTDEEISQL
jgi:hypothetical protein